MSQDSGFIFRQTARMDLSLPARVSVAPEHAGVVRFTSFAGVREGWLDVDLVDFSSKGVGFMTSVFIPRRCLLSLRILSHGAEPKRVLVEGLARVQRVVMTDRRPGYLIGTSFEVMTSELHAQIEEVVRQIEGAMPASRAGMSGV